MPEPFDIRVATSVEPPVDPQVSDIYFNAVSISAEPTVAGSDEAFEVANNPATGGGGAAALVPLSIYRVDDDNIGIQGGTVNNIEVLSQDDIGITTETRVWLKITLNSDKDVSTVEVHVPNSTDGLESTDSIAYVSIGRAFYSNGAITSVDAYANGSLGYNYGGGDYHFIYRR
jgi:hypothetical protein